MASRCDAADCASGSELDYDLLVPALGTMSNWAKFTHGAGFQRPSDQTREFSTRKGGRGFTAKGR